MSAPAKTDRELALQHKYVTEHGRAPAPGVTSCDIVEKPALMWSSAEIAAIKTLAHLDLDDVVQQSNIDYHRAKLLEKRAMVKDVDGAGGKVPAAKASDRSILVHYLRGEFDRQWSAKAATGTRVHDAAERLSLGKSVEVLESDVGYIDAWEKFYVDCQPEFLNVERILVHPSPLGRDDLEYGGRTDGDAIFHAGPLPGHRLYDYKTGGHYVGPVAAQAAGYGNALGFATYLDNGDLGPLDPMPKYDGFATVYLHADGTYDLIDPFEHISFEQATELFFSCRAALNITRHIESVERRLAKERKAAK